MALFANSWSQLRPIYMLLNPSGNSTWGYIGGLLLDYTPMTIIPVE